MQVRFCAAVVIVPYSDDVFFIVRVIIMRVSFTGDHAVAGQAVLSCAEDFRRQAVITQANMRAGILTQSLACSRL